MLEKIIKGDLRVNRGDKISHIEKIEGNLIVESGNHNFKNLQSVGGYVDISENAKASFPVLQSVGSSVDFWR